jgi:putative SOS response-associated peptidase YedK
VCARYSITVPAETFGKRFNVRVPENTYKIRYNAGPGQSMPVISSHKPEQISFFQWGLIPHWAKDETIGSKLFNARAETLDEKPSFGESFKRKRCLVPADGFYEWDKDHNPYRFVLKDNELFALAGIYDVWESGDKIINSFSIITTEANRIVGKIHERMPVILNPKDEKAWLDLDLNLEAAKSMLKSFPDRSVKSFAVERLVNNVKNDIPEVVLPKKNL